MDQPLLTPLKGRVASLARQAAALAEWTTNLISQAPEAGQRRAGQKATGQADGGQKQADMELRARVDVLFGAADDLFDAASAHLRPPPRLPRTPTGRRICRGAHLIGASLRGWDLTGVDLRSATLIAADLRDANLTLTDVLGADLRDARLHGADLCQTLFLSQPQVSAAQGDTRTRLPGHLSLPAHWR